MANAEDQQRAGIGVFESDVVVIGAVPKNTGYEIHVTFKGVAAGHRMKPTPFIDLREMWFKDGLLAMPVPTRKGILLKRESAPAIIKLMLKGMRGVGDEGGPELSREVARELIRLVCEKTGFSRASIDNAIGDLMTYNP